MSVEYWLGQIPDGWALDHLCHHWRVTPDGLERRGGATCKLVTACPEGPYKVAAEGNSLSEALTRAIDMAKLPLQPRRRLGLRDRRWHRQDVPDLIGERFRRKIVGGLRRGD